MNKRLTPRQKQKALRLQNLVDKAETAKEKFDSSIDRIALKIEEISGIKNLTASYLQGDGVGIAVGDSDNYVGVEELIKAYLENGAITIEDLENTFL